jgi:hypothetical protein
MSWDVAIINVPPEIEAASDIPGDHSTPVGTIESVHALLLLLFPAIDLSDPAWGILSHPEYSIEFSIGKNDPVLSIALHVRGGDSAIDPIERLCTEGGWRAIDFSTGEFIDFSNNPAAGLQAWRGYSEQIIASARKRGASVVVNPDLGGVLADAIVVEPRKKKWGSDPNT